MMREPHVYTAQELQKGLTASFGREITQEDIISFSELSGDYNPLHVDSDYASRSNYEGRIVHGAFQVSLASTMVGMYLPGKHVLLQTINARFPKPLYFPCEVKVTGEITAWNDHNKSGQVKVLVLEVSKNEVSAEIHMCFTLHDQGQEKESQSNIRKSSSTDTKQKTILISGATGGLGQALIKKLVNDYDIICLQNKTPLDKRLASCKNISSIQVDFNASHWEEDVQKCLDNKNLYGVIHAAWPGMPRGGLLNTQDEIIRNQLFFGSIIPLRLARLLCEYVPKEGGRFVAIGSVVGSHRPVIAVGAYSLGKSILEQTVKLLAPELARKKITINTISPTALPVGINKHIPERQRMMETAQIPMGRLCATDDVVNTMDYLLSEKAAFLSGQVLTLAGGQL